jgi:hypothetical protein
MKLDELENLWARQTLRGEPPRAAALIAEMKREVQGARRRIWGGIVLVGVLLALDLVLATAAHVSAVKRVSPVGFATEVTFFALYALFFVRAFRSARAVRRELAALGGTARESIAAALRTVELQLENARIAAYAIPAVVAICGWLFFAKYLAGELHGIAVAFGCTFMALLGLGIGGAIWHRCRTRLRPRRAELRERLHALEHESAP